VAWWWSWFGRPTTEIDGRGDSSGGRLPITLDPFVVIPRPLPAPDGPPDASAQGPSQVTASTNAGRGEGGAEEAKGKEGSDAQAPEPGSAVAPASVPIKSAVKDSHIRPEHVEQAEEAKHRKTGITSMFRKIDHFEARYEVRTQRLFFQCRFPVRRTPCCRVTPCVCVCVSVVVFFFRLTRKRWNAVFVNERSASASTFRQNPGWLIPFAGSSLLVPDRFPCAQAASNPFNMPCVAVVSA